MFGFQDLGLFFLSFFLVLPMVTMIHEFGHYFFAKIFGGSIIMHLGTGNELFRVGPLRVRKLYFYDGSCEYISISKRSAKFEKTMVYLGGSLFNIISILLINGLMNRNILEPSIFIYQFTYFSFYYSFFSLFPINHLNGCPSDGMAALNVLTNKKFDKNPSN